MLRKAESSIAVQMRTGKIGLNDFLSKIGVPGINPACGCGWIKQDIKHILLFCPDLRDIRPNLLTESGTSDFNRILTIVQGIRAAARWMIRTGWFNSFELAREQLGKSELPLRVERPKKPKKGAQR